MHGMCRKFLVSSCLYCSRVIEVCALWIGIPSKKGKVMRKNDLSDD